MIVRSLHGIKCSGPTQCGVAVGCHRDRVGFGATSASAAGVSKLGAVYLHSSVCLLPDRPNVARTVESLARRVRDGGGRARVLRTILVDEDQQASIIAEQSADRDDEYREVVERTGEFLREIDQETPLNRATYTEVEEAEADLERFDRWLASIVARDYFQAPGRGHAEAAMQRCRDALTDFEAAAVAADTETALGGTPSRSQAARPASG